MTAERTGFLTTLAQLFVAGCVATIAFDFYGQSLSPFMGMASLAPVPLADQLWGVLFGQPFTPGAHLLHYVAGCFAYPIGWYLIWQPIVSRIVPGLPWLLSSVLYGVGLWVFALYIVGHLVVGNPAFLNFTGITWVALVGHILFAVVAAAIMRSQRAAAA